MNIDMIIFITIIAVASIFCIRELIKNLQSIINKKPCCSICDFCVHFNFNGNKDDVYVGNGYCRHKKLPMDPSSGSKCTDFKCFCNNKKVS